MTEQEERIELGSQLEILRDTLERIERLTEEVYAGADNHKGRITLNNMMQAHREAKRTLDVFGRNDDRAAKRVQGMWEEDDRGKYRYADPSIARMLRETDQEAG